MVVHDLLTFTLPLSFGLGKLVLNSIELVTHFCSNFLYSLLTRLLGLLSTLNLANLHVFVELLFMGCDLTLYLFDAILVDFVLAIKFFTRAFEFTLGFLSLLLSAR